MKFKIRHAIYFIFLFVLCLIIAKPAQAVEMSYADQELQLQCTCTCQPIQTDQDDPVDPDLTPDPPLIEYDPGVILISEFVADPVSGQPEWVELYNASTQTIDLTDWTLVEGSGQITLLDGLIEPGQYFVFEKSSLNNSGDIIILSDPSGQIIDQVVYGNWDDGELADNAPSIDDPFSIIRQDVSVDLNVDLQDFVITTLVTQGQANTYLPLEPEVDQPEDNHSSDSSSDTDNNQSSSNPSSTTQTQEPTEPEYDFSDQIFINEFFPNPEGADADQEWIELYNAGSSDINLAGWSLDDEDGGSVPYEISESLVISAGDYLVFYNDITKIILNNSTDKVRLIDPNQEIIDDVGYTNVKEGQSYAKVDNDWQWTEQITPGTANQITPVVVDEPATSSLLIATANAAENNDPTAAAVFPLIEIDQINSMEIGSLVRVKGQVAAKPGIFGKKIMYLDGIQIYNSKGNWLDLQEGNEIEVQGKISQSNEERRILISNPEAITILSSEINQLEPLPVTSEQLGESLEGRLIQIQGEVVEKSGSKVKMADEQGEVVVYLKKSTDLSLKSFQLGEKYKVTGLLSQYKDEYRLLPRAENDIESAAPPIPIAAPAIPITEDVLPNDKTRRVVLFLIIGLAVALAALGGVAWYYREKIICWWVGLRMKMKKKPQ
jgi:hypothetical protein